MWRNWKGKECEMALITYYCFLLPLLLSKGSFEENIAHWVSLDLQCIALINHHHLLLSLCLLWQLNQ